MNAPAAFPPADLVALGRQLDSTARRVIREMPTYKDDYRPYVRTLARDIDLPVESLRRILRQFDQLGLVTYGPVCNPDTGNPAGSTWWLTRRGAELQEVLGK